MSYTPLTQMVRRIKRRSKLNGLYTALYYAEGQVLEIEVEDVHALDMEGLIGIYDEEISSNDMKAELEALHEEATCDAR